MHDLASQPDSQPAGQPARHRLSRVNDSEFGTKPVDCKHVLPAAEDRAAEFACKNNSKEESVPLCESLFQRFPLGRKMMEAAKVQLQFCAFSSRAAGALEKHPKTLLARQAC